MCYSNNEGNIYENGASVRKISSFNAGSKVGIEVDYDDQVVNYYLNGNKEGYSKLQEPMLSQKLYFYFELFSNNDKIRVLTID